MVGFLHGAHKHIQATAFTERKIVKELLSILNPSHANAYAFEEETGY